MRPCSLCLNPSVPRLAAQIESALAGNDDALSEIHERCEDRAYATNVTALLWLVSRGAGQRATDWLDAILDLHPGLSGGRDYEYNASSGTPRACANPATS